MNKKLSKRLVDRPISKRAKVTSDEPAYKEKKKTDKGYVWVYDEKHVEKRWKEKKEKLKKLEKELKKVRQQYEKDLTSDDDRTRAIAAIVGIMDDTAMRIGNEESAKEGTFGASTLKVKHVKGKGNKMTFDFPGKGAIEQNVVLENSKVIKVIRELMKGKKSDDFIFEVDGKKIWDRAVNRYLSQFDISAKDLRGFHANRLMKEMLKKKDFKDALDEVAEIVGHKASTLKNQYLDPELVEKHEGKEKKAMISCRADELPMAATPAPPVETEQPKPSYSDPADIQNLLKQVDLNRNVNNVGDKVVFQDPSIQAAWKIIAPFLPEGSRISSAYRDEHYQAKILLEYWRSWGKLENGKWINAWAPATKKEGFQGYFHKTFGEKENIPIWLVNRLYNKAISKTPFSNRDKRNLKKISDTLNNVKIPPGFDRPDVAAPGESGHQTDTAFDISHNDLGQMANIKQMVTEVSNMFPQSIQLDADFPPYAEGVANKAVHVTLARSVSMPDTNTYVAKLFQVQNPQAMVVQQTAKYPISKRAELTPEDAQWVDSLKIQKPTPSRYGGELIDVSKNVKQSWRIRPGVKLNPLLFDAWRTLQPFLPAGAVMTSGFRSPEDQKRILLRYWQKATGTAFPKHLESDMRALKQASAILRRHYNIIVGPPVYNATRKFGHFAGNCIDISGADLYEMSATVQAVSEHPGLPVKFRKPFIEQGNNCIHVGVESARFDEAAIVKVLQEHGYKAASISQRADEQMLAKQAEDIYGDFLRSNPSQELIDKISLAFGIATLNNDDGEGPIDGEDELTLDMGLGKEDMLGDWFEKSPIFRWREDIPEFEIHDMDESEAKKLAEDDPEKFFYRGLHKEHPKLEALALKGMIEDNAKFFFIFLYHEREEDEFQDLVEAAAEALSMQDARAFFYYHLHHKFPELGRGAIVQLIDTNPDSFFDLGLQKDYPDLEESAGAARNIKDPNKVELEQPEWLQEPLSIRDKNASLNRFNRLIVRMVKFADDSEQAAAGLAQQDPMNFLTSELSDQYSHLIPTAITRLLEQDPSYFFKEKLDVQFPQFVSQAATALMSRDLWKYFVTFKLHNRSDLIPETRQAWNLVIERAKEQTDYGRNMGQIIAKFLNGMPGYYNPELAGVVPVRLILQANPDFAYTIFDKDTISNSFLATKYKNLMNDALKSLLAGDRGAEWFWKLGLYNYMSVTERKGYMKKALSGLTPKLFSDIAMSSVPDDLRTQLEDYRQMILQEQRAADQETEYEGIGGVLHKRPKTGTDRPHWAKENADKIGEDVFVHSQGFVPKTSQKAKAGTIKDMSSVGNVLGEICVSTLDRSPKLFVPRGRQAPIFIGALFRGKLSHYFESDADSTTDENLNLRHMGPKVDDIKLRNFPDKTKIDEGWLNPSMPENDLVVIFVVGKRPEKYPDESEQSYKKRIAYFDKLWSLAQKEGQKVAESNSAAYAEDSSVDPNDMPALLKKWAGEEEESEKGEPPEMTPGEYLQEEYDIGKRSSISMRDRRATTQKIDQPPFSIREKELSPGRYWSAKGVWSESMPENDEEALQVRPNVFLNSKELMDKFPHLILAQASRLSTYNPQEYFLFKYHERPELEPINQDALLRLLDYKPAFYFNAGLFLNEEFAHAADTAALALLETDPQTVLDLAKSSPVIKKALESVIPKAEEIVEQDNKEKELAREEKEKVDNEQRLKERRKEFWRHQFNVSEIGNSPSFWEYPKAHISQRAKHAEETPKINLTPEEEKIFDVLKATIDKFNLGTTVRVAGGWVRDKLMGRPSKDIDIAIDNMMGKDFAEYVGRYAKAHGIDATAGVIPAKPEQGKHLETAVIHMFGESIDVVNLRDEEYDEESRKPVVTITDSPVKDAFRRDLTINALFYNIHTGEVEDFTGQGLHDIQNKILRTPKTINEEQQKEVGRFIDAKQIYLDDPLRVLRAIRFANRYPGFKMDPEIITAARDPEVQEAFRNKITWERRQEELAKIMSENRSPREALELIKDLGYRSEILQLPDEYSEWELDQNNPHHEFNVWGHLMEALDNIYEITKEEDLGKADRYILNWATLLHDVGKLDPTIQGVKEMGDKLINTFHSHEKSSVQAAQHILGRLKGTRSKDIKRIQSLIDAAGRVKMDPNEAAKIRAKTIKKILELTKDFEGDWKRALQVALADAAAHKGGWLPTFPREGYDYLTHQFEKVPSATALVPLISGMDLQNIFNRKPGKWIGQINKELQLWQTQAATQGLELSKEDAMHFAQSFDAQNSYNEKTREYLEPVVTMVKEAHPISCRAHTAYGWWLSPEGSLYEVPPYGHREFVVDHPELFGEVPPGNEYDRAMHMDWIRITNASKLSFDFPAKSDTYLHRAQNVSSSFPQKPIEIWCEGAKATITAPFAVFVSANNFKELERFSEMPADDGEDNKYEKEKDDPKWDEVLIDEDRKWTRRQIRDHYMKNKSKIMSEIKGKPVMLFIGTGKNQNVLKRNHNDKKIVISDDKDYTYWADRRMISIHRVIESKTDLGFVDLDVHGGFSKEKTLQYAKKIAAKIKSKYGKPTIYESGGTGYHVEFHTKETSADTLRNELREMCEDLNEDFDGFTTGIVKGDGVRTDTTTLKTNGNIRVPYALHEKYGGIKKPVGGGSDDSNDGVVKPLFSQRADDADILHLSGIPNDVRKELSQLPGAFESEPDSPTVSGQLDISHDASIVWSYYDKTYVNITGQRQHGYGVVVRLQYNNSGLPGFNQYVSVLEHQSSNPRETLDKLSSFLLDSELHSKMLQTISDKEKKEQEGLAEIIPLFKNKLSSRVLRPISKRAAAPYGWWLSPKGELFPVKTFGHESFVAENWDIFGNEENPYEVLNREGDLYKFAFDKGWIRIIFEHVLEPTPGGFLAVEVPTLTDKNLALVSNAVPSLPRFKQIEIAGASGGVLGPFNTIDFLTARSLGALNRMNAYAFNDKKPISIRAVDPLSTYKKKRDFGDTSEPEGKKSEKNQHRFVIQRHKAKKAGEHFDLRLENDKGTMDSWAVPKHKLPSKGEKLLATKTEDHPIEYMKFKGEIPEGEYGAGAVSIHDSGTYEEVERTTNKIVFKLRGKKEKGTYNLVKTDDKKWLLMVAKEDE